MKHKFFILITLLFITLNSSICFSRSVTFQMTDEQFNLIITAFCDYYNYVEGTYIPNPDYISMYLSDPNIEMYIANPSYDPNSIDIDPNCVLYDPSCSSLIINPSKLNPLYDANTPENIPLTNTLFTKNKLQKYIEDVIKQYYYENEIKSISIPSITLDVQATSE